jgi:hypothetical protein
MAHTAAVKLVSDRITLPSWTILLAFRACGVSRCDHTRLQLDMFTSVVYGAVRCSMLVSSRSRARPVALLTSSLQDRPLLPRTKHRLTMCDAANKQLISDSIRGIPDFPKKGILFWDVTTLMLDHKAFQATIDAFVERYADEQIDVVAGASFTTLRRICMFAIAPLVAAVDVTQRTFPCILQESKLAVLAAHVT